MEGFTALDFETTGFKGGETNEPWQLGVAVVRGAVVVETHEWFFRSSVRPEAPTLMEQWEEIFPLLSGRRLVAHNISTERTLLTRLAPLTKWGPWTDTLKLARARFPSLPGYQLGELCEAFGCVPVFEGRSWHDGLYDAVACAELALRLWMV